MKRLSLPLEEYNKELERQYRIGRKEGLRRMLITVRAYNSGDAAEVLRMLSEDYEEDDNGLMTALKVFSLENYAKDVFEGRIDEKTGKTIDKGEVSNAQK